MDVEVLDPVTVAPLDFEAVLNSVAKTRRLLVADPGWERVGVAAEVIARVAMAMGRELAAEPGRITLPHSHTPVSSALEKAYYPDERRMAAQLLAMLRTEDKCLNERGLPQ